MVYTGNKLSEGHRLSQVLGGVPPSNLYLMRYMVVLVVMAVVVATVQTMKHNTSFCMVITVVPAATLPEEHRHVNTGTTQT